MLHGITILIFNATIYTIALYNVAMMHTVNCLSLIVNCDMPPYLSNPYFSLARLPATTKIVVTCFLLSLLSAVLFVGLTFYPQRLADEEAAVKNFMKADAGSHTGLKADFGRHQMTNVTDEMRTEMRDGARRHAYMIVHPHSFLMPIVYFVLCHLCEMTPLAAAFKMSVYLISFAAMALSVFAPVLIWYSISFAGLCHYSFYTMLVGFAVMIVCPLVHMWGRQASRQAGPVSQTNAAAQ